MTHTKNQCVLALGFFDGVHLGHAALLERTALRAYQRGLQSAVMTFDTHPDRLVRGERVELINSAPDRAWLIRHRFDIDRVEFFNFTEETMRMPWREFLDTIRADLNAVHFVVGYDFRFGFRGEGNAERLREGVYTAVTNIGVRPTVSTDPTVTIESHLLDYSGNLYGRMVMLDFVERIRDEMQFSSVEELSAQIAADGERARKILEARS